MIFYDILKCQLPACQVVSQFQYFRSMNLEEEDQELGLAANLFQVSKSEYDSQATSIGGQQWQFTYF